MLLLVLVTFLWFFFLNNCVCYLKGIQCNDKITHETMQLLCMCPFSITKKKTPVSKPLSEK